MIAVVEGRIGDDTGRVAAEVIALGGDRPNTVCPTEARSEDGADEGDRTGTVVTDAAADRVQAAVATQGAVGQHQRSLALVADAPAADGAIATEGAVGQRGGAGVDDGTAEVDGGIAAQRAGGQGS